MIYTVSKKLLIITSIASLLFLFWCNKKSQEIESINTWNIVEQNIETATWSNQEIIWEDENSLSWKTSPLLTDTWDIKTIIDEYKSKNTWKQEKLNENDIELMEKIIDKIDKK